MIKIFLSPYALQKRRTANSLLQLSVQKGVLLKVLDGEYWGVADLCPKPELGDANYEIEIKNRGPLYRRAFELASEDLEARRNNLSLLADKPVRNNLLVTDYRTAEIFKKNFSGQTVKIKGDRDVIGLSCILNGLELEVKLRIDFNSALSCGEFDKFLSLLSASTRNKIEYIEDPTPICLEWKHWNTIIPLAFDFQPGEYSAELADFQIVKPSRQALPERRCRVTFTSAMDHPVGVAHGLRIAQKYATADSGFLTVDFYETGFEKYFVQQENNLNFSEAARFDTGIGMSAELEKLIWTGL